MGVKGVREPRHAYPRGDHLGVIGPPVGVMGVRA